MWQNVSWHCFGGVAKRVHHWELQGEEGEIFTKTRKNVDRSSGSVEFHTWLFPKIVGFPPKSSIFIGFSIIFTIHFGVLPLFLGQHPPPASVVNQTYNPTQFQNTSSCSCIFSMDFFMCHAAGPKSEFHLWSTLFIYLFLRTNISQCKLQQKVIGRVSMCAQRLQMAPYCGRVQGTLSAPTVSTVMPDSWSPQRR